MVTHWILYLAVTVLAVLLLCANSAWVFWILLLVLLALPLFSLLCSLPGMLSLKVYMTVPEETRRGMPVSVTLSTKLPGWLPHPACRMKLSVRSSADGITVKRTVYDIDTRGSLLELPAEHCGILTVTPLKVCVFDALGLFRLPRRLPAARTVTVLPEPVGMDAKYSFEELLPNNFKPKSGGGFSETYDNREYRPGDNIRQIQWKLSCKSDKLIVKEPLEPVRQRIVLAARTPANADELDLLLGRVLWLSKRLCELELPHEICRLENTTRLLSEVVSEADCERVIRELCRIVPGSPELTLEGITADRVYAVSGGEEAEQ